MTVVGVNNLAVPIATAAGRDVGAACRPTLPVVAGIRRRGELVVQGVIAAARDE